MNLPDLFTEDELQLELRLGYVTVRPHDDDPNLVIFNYTKKAQAEGRWNNVTRVCRGLIARLDSEEVVARPFDKFFNYGEHPAGSFDLDAVVEATDKMDGSLGILYPHPLGGFAIATRGSFHSEQALVGTELLQEAIKWGFTPEAGITYLFEIIYPENRIVVDYKGLAALITLDAYPTDDPNAEADWGIRAHVLHHFQRPQRIRRPLHDILSLPPRDNAEGWVLRFEGGLRVKLKQDDYVRLHRIVTGLNELAVWDAIRKEGGFAGYLKAGLPEEFGPWVDEVAGRMSGEVFKLDQAAFDNYHLSCERAGVEYDFGEMGGSRENRKAFALEAVKHDNADLLFLIADGKWDALDQALWRRVRPKGPKPHARAITAVSEVAA